MLPSSWSPTPTSRLERFGSPRDGGYVLDPRTVERSDMLISMGLEADWTFEEEYRDRTGRRVVCFDHTVTRRWWARRTARELRARNWAAAAQWRDYRRFFSADRVEHRLQMVGYDSTSSISLASILADLRPAAALLKMDIEGSEYRVLNDIVENQGRFAGLVMELHDIDLHRDRITHFFGALDGLRPVWVHANNNGGTDPGGDPLVIEVSLAPVDEPGGARAADPGPLTWPNNHLLPDIDVEFGR